MRKILWFIVFPILICTVTELYSIDKYRSKQTLSGSTVSYAKRIKQGYNLRVWLSNQMVLGMQAWDAGNSDEIPDGYGLEYPAGSGIEHLFGAGPRIGALIGGKPYVDEGYNGWDARKEFLPGVSGIHREKIWRTSLGANSYDSIGYSGYYYLHGQNVNRKGIDDDGDGTIDEDELDGLDNDGDWNPLVDDVGADGLSDQYEVSCNGKPFDLVSNPDPAHDNYEPLVVDSCHLNPDGSYRLKNDNDIYTERNFVPDHGEPNVDEDYAAISAKDLLCSATDTFHTPIISGHQPMGIKVIQKSYAWESSTSAEAIVIMEYDFVNIGNNFLQNAYVGMFADMDVGPINVMNYMSHNFCAYDSISRTAYIHNPIDRGSTPLGVTVLHTPKSLDSINTIFQWSDFSTRPDPGTNDSALYSWMSGAAFPGELIGPNQSPTNLSDSRFFFSFGPFEQFNPGDTVSAVFALVSGMNLQEMIRNAKRAYRIHGSNGFLMPVSVALDSGNGTGAQISWSGVAVSPFDTVSSYRIYYGSESQNYTDSVIVPASGNLSRATVWGIPESGATSYSAGIPDLIQDQDYYFALSAVDNKGNIGALSDEMTLTPSVLPRNPIGLSVTNRERDILIRWSNNIELDLQGYNIYRASSADSNFIKLNNALLPSPEYIDESVWGDKSYIYKVTAIDNSDNESEFSYQVNAHLIPPAAPSQTLLSPGKNFLKIQWGANTEGDLAGYFLYRSVDSSGDYSTVSDELLTEPFYSDSTIDSGRMYYYYLEAKDTTDAISNRSPILSGHTIPMNKGILVINEAKYLTTDAANFYQYLLKDYPLVTIINNAREGYGTSVYSIGDYSSVLWLSSDGFRVYPVDFNIEFPLNIIQYLNGGGRLLLSKRVFWSDFSFAWQQFLPEVFGVNIVYPNSVKNFIGANGDAGFPSLLIDSLKLSQYDLYYRVDRCGYDSTTRILYRYNSSPYDSLLEGLPVGFAARDTALKAYYLGFPLYFLDTSSAQSLLHKILTDFNEVTGIGEVKNSLPMAFQLHPCYPNPFNPTTSIKYNLPLDSRVTLKVYNLLGQVVSILSDEIQSAGYRSAVWNAADVASGLYFYRLDAVGISDPSQSFTRVKKMMLIK